MARRRFAVALVVPDPVAIEIDGLRRALGDRQLGRIDPHITIVPPINLHEEQVADAMSIVQSAAAGRGPIAVRLGPVETFGRSSPVRFLAVDPWEQVQELYDACWTGVFDRPRRRRFHPHVTIDIDGGVTDPDRDDPAVGLLAGYRTSVVIDRVSLLEHHDTGIDRHWAEYLSYRFG